MATIEYIIFPGSFAGQIQRTETVSGTTRTINLTAQPAQGYRFLRWEIDTFSPTTEETLPSPDGNDPTPETGF
jgi:hypothetical protein